MESLDSSVYMCFGNRLCKQPIYIRIHTYRYEGYRDGWA